MLIELKIIKKKPWDFDNLPEDNDSFEYGHSNDCIYVNSSMVSHVVEFTGKLILYKIKPKCRLYKIFLCGSNDYVAILHPDEWLKLEEAVNNG
jgi:hypothetical protein